MSTKIRLRRTSGNNPIAEPMDLGEPFWDALLARFGVNHGEIQPRWYPRLDRRNNLILNGNTVLTGEEALAGEDQDTVNTYLHFPAINKSQIVVAGNPRISFLIDRVQVFDLYGQI